MLAPWTQSVTLRWRPELRFYERRFEILRHLEEQGSMWSFRVSDDLAEARLIDQFQQLSVRQDRASMHLLSPDADAEVGWDALRFAIGKVQPRAPQGMASSFQYLAPLELPLAEAVARGNQGRILAPVDAHGVKTGDWAVLVDLTVDDPPGALGQTEFGVLADDEAPARLGRVVGRSAYTDRASVSPGLWEDVEFPSVALFADVTFRLAINSPDTVFENLQKFCATCRRRAGTLVEALKAQLESVDVDEEVAS